MGRPECATTPTRRSRCERPPREPAEQIAVRGGGRQQSLSLSLPLSPSLSLPHSLRLSLPLSPSLSLSLPLSPSPSPSRHIILTQGHNRSNPPGHQTRWGKWLPRQGMRCGCGARVLQWAWVDCSIAPPPPPVLQAVQYSINVQNVLPQVAPSSRGRFPEKGRGGTGKMGGNGGKWEQLGGSKGKWGEHEGNGNQKRWGGDGNFGKLTTRIVQPVSSVRLWRGLIPSHVIIGPSPKTGTT